MIRNLLLLLVFSLPIQAATVIGGLKDISGNPINSPVKFAPDGLPAISSADSVSSLNVGVSKTVTPVNGSFTIDLTQGIYNVTVQNQPSFKIFVPLGTGTYNITELATGLILIQASAGNKVSTNDLTVGHLSEKIIQGTNTLFEIINPGGDEKLKINATAVGGGGGGSGTLTSVGLAVPEPFTVSGSPLTSDGIITMGVTDPGGDRILGWKNSSGKLTYFATSQGIVISGSVLTLDIPGLPTLPSPDAATDYIVVYDLSSGNNTKLPLQNIPGLHSLTLLLPNIFSVIGNPATNLSSTITATLTVQGPNKIFAGPASGSPGPPTFRDPVPADVPNLDAAKITTGQFSIARLASGTPDGTKFVRDDGTLAVPPGGGGSGTPGGSSGQVQFNNAGAFGGSSNLTFAGNTLSAANATIATNLILAATGGTNHFLKQTSAGGAVTSGAIAAGDIPTAVDAAKVADGSVSNAEFQNLNGTTGPLQAALDAKVTTPPTPGADAFLGYKQSGTSNIYYTAVAPMQITGGTNLGLNLGPELDVVNGALGWRDGQPLAADFISNLVYQAFTHSTGMTNIGAGVSGIYFKSDGNLYSTNATAGEKNISRKRIPIGTFFSDRTTPITAGAGKARIRVPFAMTVTEVRASLTTAQASGNIITIDINEGGTSILSTKLTIDNGQKTSKGATIPAVISDTSLADDAEITIDVDQVGNGTAVEGMVWIIGYET